MRIKSGRRMMGNEWAPYEGNPVISPEGAEGHTSFSCCFPDNGTYHAFYWYNISNVNHIGHATASNPYGPYTKDAANNPVLSPSGGADASHVNVPMAWKEGTTWYMVYRGQSSTAAQTICLATASAPGGPWTKYGSNPILTGTESWETSGGKSSIDFWGIIKVGSTYYIYYNGVNANPRRTGYAYSTDLHSWTKCGDPILYAGRFCPGVFTYGGHYYWVCPHYRIGYDYSYFELWRSLSPTMANLEFVKVVKWCGATGTWDALDEDTPQIITTDIQRSVFPDNKLYIMYAAGDASNIWKTGILIADDIAAAVSMDGC